MMDSSSLFLMTTWTHSNFYRRNALPQNVPKGRRRWLLVVTVATAILIYMLALFVFNPPAT